MGCRRLKGSPTRPTLALSVRNQLSAEKTDTFLFRQNLRFSVGMALAGLAQFREEEQQEEKAVGILRQSSRDWV